MKSYEVHFTVVIRHVESIVHADDSQHAIEIAHRQAETDFRELLLSRPDDIVEAIVVRCADRGNVAVFDMGIPPIC